MNGAVLVLVLVLVLVRVRVLYNTTLFNTFSSPNAGPLLFHRLTRLINSVKRFLQLLPPPPLLRRRRCNYHNIPGYKEIRAGVRVR